MNGRIVLNVFGIALMASLVAALPVMAETRAFEKLSRSNQMIARALYDAQRTGTVRPGVAPLTLDDLAALRLQGREWTSILREMESRGLIRERLLGRVVSRFLQRRRSPIPSSTALAPGNDEQIRMVEDEARQARALSPLEAAPWNDSQAGMSGHRNQ